MIFERTLTYSCYTPYILSTPGWLYIYICGATYCILYISYCTTLSKIWLDLISRAVPVPSTASLDTAAMFDAHTSGHERAY